jgi:lipopolysaccharide export system permease protein
MLFQSSIRKELARSFGATLLALTTIVITMMLVRTLGQASLGRVNPSEIPLVLGYTMLGSLPVVLALSLFIAIMASLSRMHRDSEMTIWLSCGRSLFGVLVPVARFAWPVLVVVAALSLLVLPWANLQIHDLRARFEKRGDIERVSPGKFEESASGRRVFFMDKESPGSQTGFNVFISANEGGRETIISARHGKVVTEGGERYVLLERGQRLEFSADRNELRVAEFAEFGLALPRDLSDAAAELPARSRSTWALAQSPTLANLSELSWRFGLVMAAFNFLLIATAASTINPRVGRGGGLLVALFAFIMYYNMLNLGQNWIASGKLSLSGFMLGLHGGAFALGLFWMGVHHFNLTWRWWFSLASRQKPV